MALYAIVLIELFILLGAVVLLSILIPKLEADESPNNNP